MDARRGGALCEAGCVPVDGAYVCEADDTDGTGFSMSDTYLPSLHWDQDRQRWIPKHGFTVVELPPQVDPSVLPRPAYAIGERVLFSWYGPTLWEGEIRGIQIAGGEYDPDTEAMEHTIQRQYLRSNSMIYLIQARGHIRMVAAPKTLGISANTHLSAIWEHGYEEFEE